MIDWHNLTIQLRADYDDSTTDKQLSGHALAREIHKRIRSRISPNSAYNNIDSIRNKITAMCGGMWRGHKEYEPQYAMGEVLLELHREMCERIAKAKGRQLSAAAQALDAASTPNA